MLNKNLIKFFQNECMALYLSDLLSVAGCQLAGIKIADSPLV